MSTTGSLTDDVTVADENVQNMVLQLKESTETKCDTTFSEFKAETYRTQVVAGTNYFIKVNVGDEKYIHIRVFCALPHENRLPQVVDVQQNKTKDDTLEYF